LGGRRVTSRNFSSSRRAFLHRARVDAGLRQRADQRADQLLLGLPDGRLHGDVVLAVGVDLDRRDAGLRAQQRDLLIVELAPEGHAHHAVAGR
jgi:hypothetical protein